MKNNIFRLLVINLIAGILVSSCKKDETVNPTVGEITPAQGASNALLTLTGTGISNIRTIVFGKGNVKADITPTFNTDKAILFRVPTEAIPGIQDIIITNQSGTAFKVAFNVLGFANITDVSDYNFTKDTQITLTGKNLADVTKVVLTGTTTELAIVNKTATSLTVKFPQPSGSLTTTTLTITNAAGATTTTQSFVAIDNAVKLFTDDYGLNPSGNAFQNASWGPSSISTAVFKSGTASLSLGYNKGNWSQNGFGWDQIPNDGYKYFSFWLKGGSQDYSLYIWSAAQPGTFNTFDDFKKIIVPANVWTYYRLEVSTLKIFGTNNSTSWNQIGWRIQGPDTQDETFYIDDVLLVK